MKHIWKIKNFDLEAKVTIDIKIPEDQEDLIRNDLDTILKFMENDFRKAYFNSNFNPEVMSELSDRILETLHTNNIEVENINIKHGFTEDAQRRLSKKK